MASARLNAAVLYVGAVQLAYRAKLAREAAAVAPTTTIGGRGAITGGLGPVSSRRSQTGRNSKSVTGGDPYSKAWATRLAKYGPTGAAKGRRKRN